MTTEPNSAAQSTDVAGDGAAAASPQAASAPEQTQANASGTAAQAASAAVQAAEAPWYAALPEQSHEALKGFASVDEAMAAMKRGQEYSAPKSVEDVKLTLPEGLEGEASLLDPFRAFCVEHGIPAKQAQELVNWQTKYAADATKDYIAEGEKTLKTRWRGDAYNRNREQALVALQTLDRRMDGRLVPAAKANGMVNDPVIIEALYNISTLISEDSLGGGSPGASPEKPLEPQDYYKSMGFK